VVGKVVQAWTGERRNDSKTREVTEKTLKTSKKNNRKVHFRRRKISISLWIDVPFLSFIDTWTVQNASGVRAIETKNCEGRSWTTPISSQQSKGNV
jgi:hypothetical protein